jgi:predicted enzyme related to lactoylglutathione lyase
MPASTVLRGISTVSFFASDLSAATKWYSDFLGIDPYFFVTGYVEFRLGDHQQELGIVDSRYSQSSTTDSPAGAIVYWHVDDVEKTYQGLIALGAKPHAPIKDRGNGFRTASVVDPFGNVLGIMHNPHYLETSGAKRTANG